MESALPRCTATPPADAVVRDYERLTQLLTRHAGSADAARELLHEAWLRLAQAPPALAANASAYAYTTARHLLVDQQRHHNTRQAVEAAAVQEAAGPTDTTLHTAAHRQVLGAIEAALAALPQRTREVFLQHRLLDVPQADLAQRHRVSLATVEREIARAATALQAALDRWHGLPPASAQTRLHTSARRRGLGTLLGLAGVLGGSGLLWRVWQAQVPQWQMAWRTLRGQQTSHRLPDGSHVTLDAQTALNAAYYGNRRHLVLGSGAAFFDVAADAGRPFSVDCGVVRITVLGTRFSIERSGDRVRVDVAHGRVRVEHVSPRQSAAAMRWELTAGDGLVIAPQSPGAAPSVERVPAAGATWREGRLSFDRAPLSQILDRLARYHPRLLVVDPRVAQWPVTAEIRIAQADAWLRHVLPQAVDVKVVDTDQALRFEPRR